MTFQLLGQLLGHEFLTEQKAGVIRPLSYPYDGGSVRRIGEALRKFLRSE
jgi:hypothetical protein